MEIDLRNGDSKEMLKEYDEGTIDMILTDPPYFISDNNIVDTQSLLFKGQAKTKGFMGKEWDGGFVEVIENDEIPKELL